MQVIVRADGAYLVEGSREVFLGGIARVTASGAVVVRYPARDVTVVEPIVHGRHIDMSDLVLCIVAVVLGGLTVAEIQAVRPAVAAAAQTYLTNNGLSPGAVD